MANILKELLLVAADFSLRLFKESQTKVCGYQSYISMAINPISWTRSQDLASKDKNLGSLRVKGLNVVSYKPIKNYADAQIGYQKGYKANKGELDAEIIKCSIAPDKTISSFQFPPFNANPGIYHLYDYAFYYFNLRQNAQDRIDAFFAVNNPNNIRTTLLLYLSKALQSIRIFSHH